MLHGIRPKRPYQACNKNCHVGFNALNKSEFLKLQKAQGGASLLTMLSKLSNTSPLKKRLQPCDPRNPNPKRTHIPRTPSDTQSH